MITSLNPFGTGQCLSTTQEALSYFVIEVSIPLEQGNVFRQEKERRGDVLRKVSIPLEQGNVFRQPTRSQTMGAKSLNPFGTGQCLSTTIFT